MNKVDIKERDIVFIKSTQQRGMVTSIGQNGNDCWVMIFPMTPEDLLKQSRVVVCKPGQLVEACDSIFEVDDRVVSIFGMFVGVVTGYELGLNRVIVKSDKDTSRGGSGADRRRYSYRIDELEKEQAKITFIPGHKYLVAYNYKDESLLLAVNKDSAMIYLINVNTGSIVHELPRECPVTGKAGQHITSIVKYEGGK